MRRSNGAQSNRSFVQLKSEIQIWERSGGGASLPLKECPSKNVLAVQKSPMSSSDTGGGLCTLNIGRAGRQLVLQSSKVVLLAYESKVVGTLVNTRDDKVLLEVVKKCFICGVEPGGAVDLLETVIKPGETCIAFVNDGAKPRFHGKGSKL
jgi:hypothetical protein